MKKILAVDDDEVLLKTIVSALEEENFSVLSTGDGKKGWQLASTEKIDLIVLDLVLPGMNGFELCRKLREQGISTPVIFLSGKKKDEVDRILGLELGGDDYIIKPFSIRELSARIKAVLRRSESKTKEIETCSFGNITIDFKKHLAFKQKKEIKLTAKELALLKLLISHEGEVVSRETILNLVWGYERFPTTRTVDTFIYNLRKKIEKDPAHPVYLKTIPWAGYKFLK
jgi:two-component system, OmpR family, alkaline phosphatase synthesis response regulator PhoP